MNKTIFFVIMVFFCNNIYSQFDIDSLADMAEKRYEKKETENKKLRKQVLKLQIKLNKLLREKSEDAELKTALHKLYYANNELEKNENELRLLKRELDSIKNDNIRLKQLVLQLNGKVREMEIRKVDETNYDSTIMVILERQKKQSLAERAKELARLDSHTGKLRIDKESGAGIFNLMEPLACITAGYPFKGFLLNGSLGGTFTQDKNIFIGLGAGYHEYVKNGKFGVIPVYITTKAVLINTDAAGESSFLETIQNAKQITSPSILYVLADAGYSILVSDKNATTSSGGLFVNVGFGTAVYLKENLSFVFEASYRRQSVRQLVDKVFERTSLNFLNVQAGVGIYIGR